MSNERREMGEIINRFPVGVIINDCHDPNAAGRQGVEFQRLFGIIPTFMGVGPYSSLEAAGNLVDVLDRLVHGPGADPEQEAVILVNSAPRNNKHTGETTHDNGTPFCYFELGNILVASTFDEELFAFLHKMGVTDKVWLMSVPKVTETAVREGWDNLSPEQAERINNTQFRSLEFLPLVVSWIRRGKPVPSKEVSLVDLLLQGDKAWKIDNFDNVKTTACPEDIDFEPGKQVTLANGVVATCYERLADVPEGVTAVTVGSSGFGDKRLLEVTIRKGWAATVHNIAIGSFVFSR